MASCIGKVYKGNGNIYISDVVTAKNTLVLKQLEIKAVVSIGRGNKIETDLPVYHIILDDNPACEITRYFRPTFRFIDEHIQNGNVLVHCTRGISRFPAIVIGYLMEKSCGQFQKVYEYVKQKHFQTELNPGFYSQLQKFEKKIL